MLLKRNANIYVSTGTNITADSSNTDLIRVSDFSFNREVFAQDVSRDTLDVNQERSVKTFIEAVAPVNFSFKTYITPYLDSFTTSVEEKLWIGLLGVASQSPTGSNVTYSFSASNKQRLDELTIWVHYPNETFGSYRLENCVIDSATISFDLNSIAEIEWQGRALNLTGDSTPPTYTDRSIYAGCLKNKFSTIALNMNTVDFTLALTGGYITIDNNNIFYGRKKLGQSTSPEGHYSGNRTIKGELNFYSRSGTARSGSLLNTIYGTMATASYEATYLTTITINIGGINYPRATINIPSALIDNNSQEFGDIITTKFAFTAQETNGNYVSVVYSTSEAALVGSYFAATYYPPRFFPIRYFPN